MIMDYESHPSYFFGFILALKSSARTKVNFLIHRLVLDPARHPSAIAHVGEHDATIFSMFSFL